MPKKRAALYLRVSTAGQTVENQRRDLEETAGRHGWDVVATFEDAGVSGAKGRDKRPGLDALLKGVARRQFDIVAAWSVDRLGRSLTDLLETLGDLKAKGVDLYLHQQGLDTSTPSGRAFFQMLGVFAEFEREMIRERVNSGLARAREKGTKSGNPIGRPKIAEDVEARIRAAKASGDKSLREIAREAGIGMSALYRVLGQPPPS